MSPRPRPLRATRRWWGRRARRTKIVLLTALAGVVLLFVALLGVIYAAVRIPLPQNVALPQSVRLTYTDGSTLDTIGQVNRTNVDLAQVPVPVRQAVLAAEDHRFYSEPGISITGIGRALIADLTAGKIRQGGSTITQQYAKNAYLGSQRTFTRKIKEVVLAIKLANKYSKDQILQDYLNTIYFGRGAYGIEAASQAYFGVPVSKLDAAQGAVLAGLIRAPSYLDPRANPRAARQRWNEVVDQMVKDKALTPAQRAQLTYPVTISGKGPAARVRSSGPTSYIDAQVDAFLRRKLGEDVVDLGGLTVTTTIDKTAQAAAVAAIADHTHGIGAHVRAALISTDPQTGAIRAYFGGSRAGEADAVSFLTAPPGSSFKPITLATALANGIPLSKTYDGSSPQTFNGTPVSNFNNEQFGQIDLPTATAHSVNTVYIQLARDADPAKIVALAHQLGIPDQPRLDPVPEIALGTTDERPLDMAGVYGTFAAGGRLATPYLVAKVVDRHGNVLYSASPHTQQVLSARVAADTTYALQQVLVSGTAAGYGLAGGRPAAGKTGTVSNNIAGWFDGYTPQLSTVVGVFDTQRKTIAPYPSCGCSQVTGGTAAAPIWQQYMNAALAGAPVLPFPPPQDLPTSSAPPTTSSSAPTTTSSAPTTTSSAPPTSASPTPSTATPTPSVSVSVPTPSSSTATASPSPTTAASTSTAAASPASSGAPSP